MKKADNQLLVIFGASGDLTRRKLMPSLFELYVRGLLPKRFAILGASRSEYTDDTFRQQQREGIRRSAKGASYDDGQIDEFLRMIHYVSFEPTEYATYGNLKNRIGELLETLGSPDRVVYYLATPPVLYETIPAGLKEAGLNVAATKKGWRRIVVEKPFGTDLESARRLSELLRGVFEENGIYRIDHYLGKETVQNILVLRFSNGIFEPLWNRNYIDYVEISATETLGVENRGPYYESAGALRDMIQNHLLQLMAFVAMEPPAVFEPEPIRNEIVKVFRAIRRYTPAEIGRNVLRAQYTGCEIDGQYVPGYREEKNVAPDSTTETFVAMKLFIDNWRWGGVPFLFHTGKRLSKKQSRSRDPLQIDADATLFGPVLRAFVQQAHAAYPARREHLAEIRTENARRGTERTAGQHGFPLRLAVVGLPARRLRTAAVGRDARRLDAVRPPRLARSELAVHRPDPAGLEAKPAAGPADLSGADRRARPAATARRRQRPAG